MATVSVAYADETGSVLRCSIDLTSTETPTLEDFVEGFGHVVLSLHAGETCLYRSAVELSDF